MDNVAEIEKAFHEARIVGEQLLEKGEIRWTDYAEMMVGFEAQLREMEVDL